MAENERQVAESVACPHGVELTTHQCLRCVQAADCVADPVQVHEAWIATCDSCGWHTQPVSPKGVVREWARLHRVTCPLKTGADT